MKPPEMTGPLENAIARAFEALAADACAVVTDDWPCFFLPRMQAAAAKRLDVLNLTRSGRLRQALYSLRVSGPSTCWR